MNLEADSFQRHLAAGKLAQLYVIASDDPLLAGEAADALRAAARDAGYTERESHVVVQANKFPWDQTFAELRSLSLFASRRIFELRLPGGKPGTEGAAALRTLAASLTEDTLCIIHLPELNKTARAAKWAATLSNAGVWVTIRSIPPDRLVPWLQRRAAAAGIAIEADAAQMLAARTEGNLLAAHQEINKLQLLLDGAPITVAAVRDSVADGARFTVYQLADAALGQDLARAMRVFAGLRREGVAPQLVCWSLSNAARNLVQLWWQVDAGKSPGAAMQDLRIFRQSQGLYQRALAAHNAASIRRVGQAAASADRVGKGAMRGSPWQALYELIVLLAEPARRVRAPTVGVA
ncbi:MAG: DNA polymerase III subunit delta [Gammaproteobacteria bacterium]|nr:DNA polymerase III subunit delta [Gammaproteobacteria bacterium]